MNPIIVWFRDDLRLADNPALHAAAKSHRPLVCVYIYDEKTRGLRAMGAASRWWLHGSLHWLHEALGKQGGRLPTLRGAWVKTLPGLGSAIGADAVYWTRRYDKAGSHIDEAAEAAL